MLFSLTKFLTLIQHGLGKEKGVKSWGLTRFSIICGGKRGGTSCLFGGDDFLGMKRGEKLKWGGRLGDGEEKSKLGAATEGLNS